MRGQPRLQLQYLAELVLHGQSKLHHCLDQRLRSPSQRASGKGYRRARSERHQPHVSDLDHEPLLTDSPWKNRKARPEWTSLV